MVDALSAGFADGTRWAFLVAAAFLALGLVAAIRLSISARQTDDATTDAG